MSLDLEETAERALELDKFSIARLITVFEDTRAETASERGRVLRHLDKSHPKHARFLGFTGTPGAGKSTLIGELALRYVGRNPSKAAAVLAIDPSSHVSGGALLGDRTRVRFPVGENRLYFRSQASDLELGGVGRATFQVCRLLARIFDTVFVETVGIGQNEIEIQHVADRVYLVLQPLAGDQIQFMKAGIMEIPDVFILNKSDEADAAERSYHSLRASLAFVRPGEQSAPILRTSARTGLGLDELIAELESPATEAPRRSMREKEIYYFEKWVRDEFGRKGLRKLAALGGAASFFTASSGFDEAQVRFAETAGS